MPPASYRAYGLTLRSSVRLPGLVPVDSAAADVSLKAGPRHRFARARAQVTSSPSWFVHRQLADGTTYLRWSGLFEFLIAPDGRRIAYHREPHGTLESFTTYLLGQVLSFSLLAFGVETLHGTVVDRGGEAVVLLGDCGYGKSTLGAALLARGCPIVTDDVVALEATNGRWTVHPGIARLKLFPEMARRLLGPSVLGTPMNNGTSKLVLPLNDVQSARQPLPVKTIYVLSDPSARRPRGAAQVHIDPLSASEAFFALIAGAFNLLVVERDRIARQFEFASQLVARVPVRRLTYHRSLPVLAAACDAILADRS